MENDIETRRNEAIEELQAAFAGIGSGEGLARFIGGHGVQSRVFEFRWSEPSVEIDFRLPCERVLSAEETQKGELEEIGAVIRMAILLLSSVEQLKAMGRLEVSCDERGTNYAVYNAEGELEDFGDDWAPLVKRLESELGDIQGTAPTIIWP